MISEFQGQYRFLSNFWPCHVRVGRYMFPSAEHAYQAHKFINRDFWAKMAYGDLTAAQAKKLGSTVELREDWNEWKIPHMRNVVKAKFEQNPDLMDKLIATKNMELVEGNIWGDRFWGQSPVGYGRNELGKILMAIRDDITKMG